MEKSTIAVGMRVYSSSVSEDGNDTIRKGTITKIHKKLFSKHHVFVVLWDDGEKGKYTGAEIHNMIEDRADRQAI